MTPRAPRRSAQPPRDRTAAERERQSQHEALPLARVPAQGREHEAIPRHHLVSAREELT